MDSAEDRHDQGTHAPADERAQRRADEHMGEGVLKGRGLRGGEGPTELVNVVDVRHAHHREGDSEDLHDGKRFAEECPGDNRAEDGGEA